MWCINKRGYAVNVKSRILVVSFLAKNVDYRKSKNMFFKTDV